MIHRVTEDTRLQSYTVSVAPDEWLAAVFPSEDF